MSLTDSLLLTLLNAAACLALPKLLSIVMDAKEKITKSSQSAVRSLESNSEIPGLVDAAR
ncbi:hypothetical protein I8752_09520 [Nostocaceae cyanobacterium CENA369]|jgi:hypothetical protein|uniref:Uncharacterized protein n=1 Tax=Dendronalium phyllosphericum CENA369 TaxID=1725256 RepID=A0A8J7LDP2_9NOST|nr:hypothetical protein [Dendronalium phyllosphericum]MBH8573251.1 hypothetical protein [Dendronalium phyllosphericum CENA369]